MASNASVLLICMLVDCGLRLIFAEKKEKYQRETGKTPTVITGFSVIGIITPTFELVKTRMVYSVCS